MNVSYFSCKCTPVRYMWGVEFMACIAAYLILRLDLGGKSVFKFLCNRLELFECR